MATFREAIRALREAVEAGDISESDPAYGRYLRRLMKGPAEHNWGLSIDHTAWATDWNNAESALRRATDSDWQRHEEEWIAQREWVHPCLRGVTSPSLPLTCNATNAASAPGVDSVGWEAFVRSLQSRLQQLTQVSLPTPDADMKEFTADLLNDMEPILCGRTEIAFSGTDGAIRSLTDVQTGRQWVAGGGGTLASFRYRTYSDADFSDTFAREYTASGDFMKQGMASASPFSREWEPILVRGFIEQPSLQNGQDGCHAIMELIMEDELSVQEYGAPLNISIEYKVPGKNGALLDVNVTLSNKTSTRLAESTWFSFAPISTEPTVPHWEMDIMGNPVSPLEVVDGGTHWIHAVETGVTFMAPSANASRSLRIFALDTPLLSPGDTAHALRYNDEQPDAVHGGMHFMLHNNLWGTAFPQWYPFVDGDNLLARFQVFADP